MIDKELKDWCKNCDVEPPAMKFKSPDCEHNPDKEQINNFAKDINVPHKEQIMNDGVDVNKCKYRDSYTNFCLAEKDDIGETYTICTGTDCYFKRLARKTQECEELKNTLEKLTRGVVLPAISEPDVISLTDRYRKALEEIKEIVSSTLDCGEWVGQGDDKMAKILDIINKAKGEGNEE